ncbi:MAG: Secreted and surface protein containing fasciclin-like repeats, partial [uncultured Sphingomonadaceae bacterium]
DRTHHRGPRRRRALARRLRHHRRRHGRRRERERLRQRRTDRHRRRRRHVPVAQYRAERGQLARPHYAGRRGAGRRARRDLVRPRPVHRFRADQRCLRQAARGHGGDAAPPGEQGAAPDGAHLPRRPRPPVRRGPDGAAPRRQRHGAAHHRAGWPAHRANGGEPAGAGRCQGRHRHRHPGRRVPVQRRDPRHERGVAAGL